MVVVVVAAATRMKNDLTHCSLNTENMTLFTDGRDASNDDEGGGDDEDRYGWNNEDNDGWEGDQVKMMRYWNGLKEGKVFS